MSLSIHGKEMLKCKKEKYLGNILTSNGKISENILSRCNKSIGLINDIMSTLNEVSFGYYYFEIGILFRNSKLINGILCSIEALYGLNNTHVEKLEKCDNDFFRRLFKSGACTPVESFYLATNTLPIRHIITGRRLMFLWSILNKSESDLVRKCLAAQQLNPVKNDLITTFEQDLEMCGITLTMTEISNMKKTTFRKIVDTHLREVARAYLLKLKNKHSKLNSLSDSYKLEPYLSSVKLSTEEKQTLFKLRTRMVDVKSNFKMQYGQNLTCNFCSEIDFQSRLLSCEQLTDGIDVSNTEYEHIFQDMEKQEKVAIIFNKILKKINSLMKQMSLNNESLLQNTQSL